MITGILLALAATQVGETAELRARLDGYEDCLRTATMKAGLGNSEPPSAAVSAGRAACSEKWENLRRNWPGRTRILSDFRSRVEDQATADLLKARATVRQSRR